MTIRHVVCPQFTRSSTYGVFVVTNSDLNKRAVRSFSLIFMYISWSVWVQPDTNTSVMYLNKVRVNFISPLVVFFRLQPLDLEEFKVPLFGPEHRPLKKKKKIEKKRGFHFGNNSPAVFTGCGWSLQRKKKKKKQTEEYEPPQEQKKQSWEVLFLLIVLGHTSSFVFK